MKFNLVLFLIGASIVIGIIIGASLPKDCDCGYSNCHIVTSCTPEIKYLERDCPSCVCQDCPETDCIKELIQAKEYLNRSAEVLK